MKIFISWSGETSRTVARVLGHWLPSVVHSAEPWVPDLDIHAGTPWNEQIRRELNEAQLGILCVTTENMNSPWLLFEAGILAHRLDYSHVYPYLIGLDSSQLPGGPLAQFQPTLATKQDTRKMVFSINEALGNLSWEPSRVGEVFERSWPDLENVLRSISVSEDLDSEATTVAGERSQLLFRKHSGETLSPLEEERLEVLTSRLKSLLPPVSVGELKNLLAMTEDVESIRERARERRRRLVSN